LIILIVINKRKLKGGIGYMRKNRKTHGFFKAAVVIAVAVAFILPGSTAFANTTTHHTIPTMNRSLSPDDMQVENTTGSPGTNGHEIYITGTWSIELGGYELAMYYDATKLEIADVNLEGTVADYGGSEWLVYWSYNDTVTPAYVLASALTWGSDIIGAGSGNLFKLVVNISESAPEGDTDLDLAQNVGSLPSYCSYADPVGGVVFPDLIDGILTIAEAQYVCGDANDDGSVGAGDIVYLISYLFRGGPPPDPLCVGDANGDDAVGAGDIVYLISYLFRGGPAPVPDCCDPPWA
jgi:hypothetical protein